MNPAHLNQSMLIQNKVVKPIEVVLFSENDSDINGEFRDPLEIFVKRYDDGEKEPYICRKISRDDGLIYYLNKKPAKVENIDAIHQVTRKLRMLICVTLFDESERKLTQTLECIYDNLESFCSNEISPEDLAVVVIADGIQCLDDTMLEFFERLDKDMGGSQLTVAARLNKINEENENYVAAAKSDYEKTKRRNDVDTLAYFPTSMAKKTSICYQARCSAKDFPHTTLYGSKYSDVKMNIFFMIKMTNTGKLASHMWFFQGFCKFFNPDYCTILECGTRPDKRGLFHFFRALESDRNLGAVCGYLSGRDYDIEYQKIKQVPFTFPYDPTDHILMKIVPIIMNYLMYGFNFVISIIENIFSLQKAQQFEYAWDNIFNKNFQSIFRYIPVLPSAWSAYRWDALCEDNLLEKEYLNTVKDPDYVYKSIKEANKMLTEDRLLSLAIFTKRNRCYFLKYCPDAKAETDLIETVPELLNQRKRIINGSWYAIEHIIYYNNQIRYSRHTNISKMMFSSVVMMSKINLILLYLTPTFYYVALKIVMFEYLVNVSLVANPATSLAGFFLFLFIALMTSLIFISLQFKSIDKDMSFFFRVLSHFMGIFMLFTFGVLMKLLATEIFSTPVGYFMSQTLIQIFVLVIFGSIAFVVLLNPPSWRHLFFGFLHYLYYLPTYAHITTVYAFCRIDDLSWGATGAHVTPPAAQRKEFKDFKVEFVATWLIVNTLFAYIIIVVTSSPTNEGGFLTFMLFLMAALTSFKALWSCIYALKYRLFDQKTHYEKTKELKQYYKKSKEEIEKYYEKIKFGGDASVVMEDDSVQQPQGNEVENSVLLAVGRANPFSAFGQNKKSIVATG